MMLFQHALVVVRYRQLTVAVNLEHVCATSMCHIMAQSSKHQRETSKVVKHVLCLSLKQNQSMNTLHHLYSMIVVMKWVVSFVIAVL
jgi:hypothetical protein